LKMVVNIKEILRMVYLNKMVYFNGQMVWNIKELLNHLVLKVLENIHG
jgi:hypothetical protein